jgi:hypothetical protein
MIDFISKYRSAPERKHIVIGIKAFAGLTSPKEQNPAVKFALKEIKAVRSGVMSCHKELNLLLCDVCMLATFITICTIIKCRNSACKRADKSE